MGREAEKQLNVLYSCISDKGGRPVNEDYLGASLERERKYFVLCDGLGGHGNGDVASKHVVEQMLQALDRGLTIEESIANAQNSLLTKQEQEHAGDSMKTTVTCLTISNQSARFGHVGDSRIYHFEKEKYKRRSMDHSVPQMLANRGEIKDKDIRHHEDRSRLIRVMGIEWTSPKYEIVDDFPVTKYSSFLLCSDGFWELIDEKDMCKTLHKSKTPEDWLNQMEKIVKRNGEGTNMDNYSAIAVFVRER